jgi:hypothetical protein
LAFHAVLDCSADIDNLLAVLCGGDSLEEALFGHPHEAPGRLGSIVPTRVGRGAVADEATVAHSDIDAEDVAFVQQAVGLGRTPCTSSSSMLFPVQMRSGVPWFSG